MYTSKQVREAIEGMEKQAPDNWWPLVKSLIVDLYEGVEKLSAEHATTLKGAKGLARQFKGMRDFFDQLQAKLGITSPAETAAPPAPDAPPRMAADKPLNQAELEQQMDAAIGAAPSAPIPPAAPQAPPRGKRPAPPPVAARAANGEPLTPEQAELEQQMDAAIAGG
jgi:hypothetical protein